MCCVPTPPGKHSLGQGRDTGVPHAPWVMSILCWFPGPDGEPLIILNKRPSINLSLSKRIGRTLASAFTVFQPSPPFPSSGWMCFQSQKVQPGALHGGEGARNDLPSPLPCGEIDVLESTGVGGAHFPPQASTSWCLRQGASQPLGPWLPLHSGRPLLLSFQFTCSRVHFTCTPSHAASEQGC